MTYRNQTLRYDDMLDVFLKDGVVESNSSKNRYKLYKYLEEHNIKFKKEIIGYWNSYKKLSWSSETTEKKLKLIVKWISSGRFLPEDIKDGCYTKCFKFDDIKEIFDDNMSNREKYNIIKKKWGEDFNLGLSWSPFSFCPLRNPIVRITRI